MVGHQTKRYINITANPQSDFQANPREIWTFRSSSLKRSKRTFLAYGMGGVVKLVLGVSLPITLASPKRSLRVFYNLQLQYVPPPDPIYWWSFLNSTTFESRTQRSKHLLLYDNSRSLIYKFLEKIFRSIDALNNQECLQRFICDLSRTPLNVDSSESVYYILHKIVNAIFTVFKQTQAAFNKVRKELVSLIAKFNMYDELFTSCEYPNSSSRQLGGPLKLPEVRMRLLGPYLMDLFTWASVALSVDSFLPSSGWWLHLLLLKYLPV
uniref:Uncharacterized protein n=1 Tax=Glossina pallidipes TaxID=7398 RepID=A0A1A9ZCJ2_GLOPL